MSRKNVSGHHAADSGTNKIADSQKNSSYRVPAKTASAEFVERRSRFIGSICPVKTEEEALAFLDEIRRANREATHNVYAYILRDGQMRRYSDDGEPQGTAGIPVLEVLLRQDLTDCAVVVTRYFGGILLGAGGLVRAYSHAAALVVEAAGIAEMRRTAEMSLHCDYGSYGGVNALISEMGGIVTETDFSDAVTLCFRLPSDDVHAFSNELTERTAGRITAAVENELFFPW